MKCFVSMPTGRAFADVYDSAILPAIEGNGLKSTKVEDLNAGSVWRLGFQELIESSNLVIAVVGDDNLRSFTGFEIGFAAALKKPIILLARSFQEVPFDLQQFRFLSYSNDPQSLAQLRRDLTREVRRVVKTLSGLASASSAKIEPSKEFAETEDEVAGSKLLEEYKARGDYASALELLTRAIKRQRAAGNRPALAAALNSASVAYQALGRYEEALSALQEAFQLLASVEEPRQRAMITANLANVLLNTGDLDQARTFYRAALDIAETIGDSEMRAEISGNYAQLLYTLGNYEEAEVLYLNALEIFEKSGNQRSVAIAQANLAALLQQQGQLDRAQELFERAHHVFNMIGDVRGRASLLHNLASLKQSRGDSEEALALLQESLHLKRQLGDRSGSAFSLAAIGHNLISSGRVAEGLEALYQSAKIQEEVGDRLGLAQTLSALGAYTAQYGDAPAAENMLERALAMAVSIGAPERNKIKQMLGAVRLSQTSAE